MNILISGGTGFIGKHLIKYLSNFDLEITSIVRSDKISGFKKKEDSHVLEYHFKELCDIEKGIPWQKVNFLINLATNYKSYEDDSYISEAFDSNIIFPQLLIKNCYKNDIPFITFGSYQQEMSRNVNKKSFYLQSKIMIHDLVQGLASVSEFKYIELILNDTYGIGDNRSKILDSILKTFKGDKLKTTPGDQLLNLLNVKDVCEAIYFLINELIKKNISYNNTFGVRSKQFISIKDLAKICGEIKGVAPRIEWGALEYRGNELFATPNLSPILPNWSEKVSLHEGISELIKHNSY
jgi:nucleoside-diphosphate-sugar epimerase